MDQLKDLATDIVAPIALVILAPALTIIAAAIVGGLKKLASLVNVTIDAGLEAKLKNALNTGLVAAVARRGIGAAPSILIQEALEHVMNEGGAPDTVKKLVKQGVTMKGIENVGLKQLDELLQSRAMTAGLSELEGSLTAEADRR